MNPIESLWHKISRLFTKRPKNLKVFAIEIVNADDGLQIGSFGKTETDGQKIGARRANWFEDKTMQEEEVARIFASHFNNKLTQFEKVEQDSDVDILGRSADGTESEKFQIVYLYDSQFWKELNTKNAVDMKISFDQLTQMALRVTKKKGGKYSPTRLSQLNLLISTSPAGLVPDIAEKLRTTLKTELGQFGFKAIWLVGATSDQVFQMN